MLNSARRRNGALGRLSGNELMDREGAVENGFLCRRDASNSVTPSSEQG